MRRGIEETSGVLVSSGVECKGEDRRHVFRQHEQIF